MRAAEEYFTRGEIWLANLEPAQSLEQARARLVLILSANTFNNGPAELLIIAPITTRRQNVPAHVEVRSPEGGLNRTAFVLCEQLQSVSTERLIKRLGRLNRSTMELVEDRVCILLNLYEPR